MQFDYSQMTNYFTKTNDRERASGVVRFTDPQHQYHYTRMLLERKYLIEHKKLDRSNPIVLQLSRSIRAMIDDPNMEHYQCMHISTQERFEEMKELGARLGYL